MSLKWLMTTKTKVVAQNKLRAASVDAAPPIEIETNDPDYVIADKAMGLSTSIDLVSYNHEIRFNFKRMPKIAIACPPQHMFVDFTSNMKMAEELEQSTLADLRQWKAQYSETHGIFVEGGKAVTVSWMLYLEGPNVMDVSATCIRDAVTNRKDEIMQYLRSMLNNKGGGEGGAAPDNFALDWKRTKPTFNDSRCIFPIYAPGLCIKLSRKGAHITGPKTVRDFVGVSEFVRGFYTKVSKEKTRPHHLKDFTVSMLNVPIKLHLLPGRDGTAVAFPDRKAIHQALQAVLHDARTMHSGSLWDNAFNRCCISDLKFVPEKFVFDKFKRKDTNKGYAGVNFRYAVHGEKIPGLIGNKMSKWPWVTLFDNGKFSIINHNPQHIVKTIKFVVEFIAGILDVSNVSNVSNAAATRSQPPHRLATEEVPRSDLMSFVLNPELQQDEYETDTYETEDDDEEGYNDEMTRW